MSDLPFHVGDYLQTPHGIGEYRGPRQVSAGWLPNGSPKWVTRHKVRVRIGGIATEIIMSRHEINKCKPVRAHIDPVDGVREYPL